MRFARQGLGLYFSFQILDEKTAEALVSTRQTAIPHETLDGRGENEKRKGRRKKKTAGPMRCRLDNRCTGNRCPSSDD